MEATLPTSKDDSTLGSQMSDGNLKLFRLMTEAQEKIYIALLIQEPSEPMWQELNEVSVKLAKLRNSLAATKDQWERGLDLIPSQLL
jgi:hypothetical protein